MQRSLLFWLFLPFMAFVLAIPSKAVALETNIETPYTRLHRDKLALLVIDGQNDFGDPKGAHPMPDLASVMPKVVRAIKAFRAAKAPVIHVVRLYEADGANVDMCRRWQVEEGALRIIVPGTWGSQLVDSTNPTGADLNAPALLRGEVQQLTPAEYVIYKPRFNAFVRTGLRDLLERLKVDSVVIVGITFPNCVRATQIGATDHDYRVGLVPEACTQTYAPGVAAMRGEGVQIMSIEDLEAFLGSDKK